MSSELRRAAKRVLHYAKSCATDDTFDEVFGALEAALSAPDELAEPEWRQQVLAKRDSQLSHAVRLAADARKELAEARAVIASLCWPNVPSGDDMALLIRMNSSSTEASEKAIELAERLKAAQQRARDFLKRTEPK